MPNAALRWFWCSCVRSRMLLLLRLAGVHGRYPCGHRGGRLLEIDTFVSSTSNEDGSEGAHLHSRTSIHGCRSFSACPSLLLAFLVTEGPARLLLSITMHAAGASAGPNTCPSSTQLTGYGVGVCSPRPDGHIEFCKYGLTCGWRRSGCQRSRLTEVYGRCDPCLREDLGQGPGPLRPRNGRPHPGLPGVTWRHLRWPPTTRPADGQQQAAPPKKGSVGTRLLLGFGPSFFSSTGTFAQSDVARWTQVTTLATSQTQKVAEIAKLVHHEVTIPQPSGCPRQCATLFRQVRG